VKFEWDEQKNRINIRKHRISFEDARAIFEDVRITAVDTKQSYAEIREISLGMIRGRVCVVVYTERKGATRIISARKANQRERRRYNEFIKRAET
jgi:uncharacterized DUF497 family protein